MAGSRTFTNTCSGNHGSHYIQSLIVEWADYEVVNNRTYVKITYQRTTENQGYWYNYGYANPSQISIDGSQVASATPYSAHNSQVTQTLCTWEGYIGHNTDGTKTINVGASFSSTSGNLSGGSVSGTVQLPTIPRASTISVNNQNIGENTLIVVNAYANFSHELYWKSQSSSTWQFIESFSSQAGQTIRAWLVPTSLYSLIPNNPNIVCDFQVVTFSGSTRIGNNLTTATFTATGNPIINTTNIIDINNNIVALTGDNTKLVMYQSNAKVSVGASGQNSATISNVKINGINATYNSTSEKWELTIENVETNEFEIKVTDSRGYITTTTETTTKIDYIPLTINATLNRNQPTDGKINVSINGNYFNGDFGAELNELVVQYRYVEYGGTYQDNWQDLTPTITNNTYSLTSQLSNFDYTKQYEFQVRAYDLLMEQQVIGIPIPKGKPVYNWEDDFFNINGDIKYYENSILEYSTNETLIGKDENGNNIYRNVIRTTLPSATGWNVVASISNVNEISYIYGTIFATDGRQMPINHTEEGYQISCTFKSGNIEIKQQNPLWYGNNCRIVVVYNKTTN